MKKFITEILEDINEDPKRASFYINNNAFKTLMEYATNPEKKWLLPKGNPPFKEDPAPFGMSEANLLMEIRRLYIFLREDLPAVKREQLFINLLEGIHPSEAKLLIAVKDQTVHKIYKKVTHKMLHDAGLVSTAPAKKSTTKKAAEA